MNKKTKDLLEIYEKEGTEGLLKLHLTPKEIDEVVSLIDKDINKLEKKQDNLFNKVIEKFKESTKKDCYEIELLDEEPSILDDKIGGIPYFPEGEEYPIDKNGNPMALLLQINLKKIDLDGYPKKGILEIYTDKDVNYPSEYAIKYFDEGLNFKKDLPKVDVSNYIIKKPYKISLKKSINYMSPNDYRFENIFCDIVNSVYKTDLKYLGNVDDYFKEFDWFEKLSNSCDKPLVSFGGYPDFTQRDPRDNEMEEKEECIFKLDSIVDMDNITLGDSGILNVLITKKDIENCNFENGIVTWDCY